MEMRPLRSVALSATVVALSACGGTTVPMTFAERESSYVQASSALSFTGGVPANPTLLTGVPTSSSKTYSGQMALIVRNSGTAADITLTQNALSSEGIIGDINLTANFMTNGGTLTGSATNFVDSNNSEVVGTLTLFNTVINRNNIAPIPENVSYTANISGTLTGTPAGGTANLNGISLGGFAEPNATLWGTAFSDSNPSAGEAAFRGIFVANEN